MFTVLRKLNGRKEGDTEKSGGGSGGSSSPVQKGRAPLS